MNAAMDEAIRLRYMRGALGGRPEIALVETVSPQPDAHFAITIHFKDDVDRELLAALRKVSDNLEADILALLHLAVGHKLRRSK